MNKTGLQIIIDVREVRWKTSIRSYRKVIEKACREAFGNKKCFSELAVVLVNDAIMKDLNSMFRGKNKPTNVLSFPGEESSLGDIVLAYQTIQKEAGEQGKSMKDHFTHLLVHGVLHLTGYDHKNENDAAKMEKQEIKILKKLGVSNPYL